jgi:hypothetical protein
MDAILKSAPLEDIITAFELIHEQDRSNDLKNKIFGIDTILSFINFGCIKNTDNVYIVSNESEIISFIISYLYTPDKIVTNVITNKTCNNKINYSNTRNKIISNNIISNNIINKSRKKSYHNHIKQRWKWFHQLLMGYQYTKNIVMRDDRISLNYIVGLSFDVAIVRIHFWHNQPFIKLNDRFAMELGEEYELFEKYLKETSENLTVNGVLILLARPCWILKVWNQLDDLNLVLDYQDYHLYIDNTRDPNTFVWLKLVKSKDINLDMKKKNILNLMSDNNIDRLYAHRNNLLFPFVILNNDKVEAYIDLDQNLEYMQYFFTLETTRSLANLCDGFTACLVTPSVAQCAFKEGKNIILFERDNRFRVNGGLKFVKYDLNKGLSNLLNNKYLHKFDKVICDPPFNIKLDVLANDIHELLKQEKGSVAYVVFPSKEKAKLISAMKSKQLFLVEETNRISIEYARPPKIVRVNGKDAIQIFKFKYAL